MPIPLIAYGPGLTGLGQCTMGHGSWAWAPGPGLLGVGPNYVYRLGLLGPGLCSWARAHEPGLPGLGSCAWAPGLMGLGAWAHCS